MNTFEIHGKKIHSWCETIEDGAMKQIGNLAKLPFVMAPIAIMADCHEGFGMPIGGVLATKETIIPNAVGVDIGCGMQAVETSLFQEDLHRTQLETFVWGVRGVIPVGFAKHEQAVSKNLLPNKDDFELPIGGSVIRQHFENARKQIGTLGGGNHFIEVQADEDERIWLMLHSGSRNVGLQVAKYYHNQAVEARMREQRLYVKDLAHLNIDSELGKAYIAEMKWCVAFARKNRELMMLRIMELLNELVRCDFGIPIEIAHNFAAEEEHFGERVWVHRKGATRARKNELGIILGSQGTNSYIVRGKGLADSLESCSHGAGRVMSRKQAVKNLDLKKEQNAMNAKGILHSLHSKKDLDEASTAYKNIDEVMAAQTDLVEIEVKLRPLAVIKG